MATGLSDDYAIIRAPSTHMNSHECGAVSMLRAADFITMVPAGAVRENAGVVGHAEQTINEATEATYLILLFRLF